jgi:mono/diheme cytochrome c family protein
LVAAVGALCAVPLLALLPVLTTPGAALAAGPWKWGGWWHHHKPCGHPGCGPDRCCQPPAGWAGAYYWMRSPDQEQRVVMSLFNRYCVRCHGIDGRGVWDIPDVPDFTDPRWQASRPDPQIVNILMEGRGAVMPSFRGTLTLEEACAMANYLRTFVPGTEISRPDVGRASSPPPTPTPAPAQPTAPAPSAPAPSPR